MRERGGERQKKWNTSHYGDPRVYTFLFPRLKTGLRNRTASQPHYAAYLASMETDSASAALKVLAAHATGHRMCVHTSITPLMHKNQWTDCISASHWLKATNRNKKRKNNKERRKYSAMKSASVSIKEKSQQELRS